VLSVTEGGVTDKVTFASGTNFSGTTFALGSGAFGGTAVTLVAHS
jgi:hypothetical protein